MRKEGVALNRPEQALQKTIAQYLRIALPVECWWTAVNPSPGKTRAAAGLSKAMGMRPGCPDLIFVHNGRFFAIELKAATGKPPSDNQMINVGDIMAAGGTAHFCTSLPEVQGVLMAHGIKLRAR